MSSKENMNEASKALNLDIDSPKIVSNILTEISLIQGFFPKLSKLDFYIDSLEEELTKIDAFKRELPYCMQLLQDASEKLKKESLRLKEKRKGGVDELKAVKRNEGAEPSNKKDWMNHGQLWSAVVRSHDDSSSFKSGGGGVEAMKKAVKEEEKGSVSVAVPVEIVSLPVVVEAVDSSVKQPKKQRRCWSPELHKLFLHALLQLGGPYVATPKQIRELMNVDGLTNDEVKSHLQKYRLHIRRLPGSSSGVTATATATDAPMNSEDGGGDKSAKPE